jgi:predicted ATPase
MGAAAAHVAEIVEIRDKLPDLETPAAPEPEAARFRLFDSIATFLKNASQSQPLMLVMDDLHWADRSSLRLLEFLTRELGASHLLVVGCYRDMELSRQHPLSETLAQISREPVFRRQVLRGLDQQDTVPFIEATAGVQLSEELAETIYSHTEGNPFFLTEVIRLLADRGELEQQDVSRLRNIRIPEGIREAIGQRLNRLSEQCNQALVTALIIGREFDFKLLVRLNEEGNEDGVLEALEEALAARVIEEVSETSGGYRFAHALIQETLLQELSATRRARLHARVAEAQEVLYGDDAESHSAELAHHFSQAEAVAGTEKLVRYSVLAGERALAASAYEKALGHFQRALAAKEGHDPLADSRQVRDRETAEVFFGLGRAHAAMFQRGEAFASLTRAFEYYADTGDVDSAVAVSGFPINPGLGRVRVTLLIRRALELVHPGSPEAGNLLSRYGYAISSELGQYEEAQDAFSQALAIAHQQGDSALELRTLGNAIYVDISHLRWRECLEKSNRVIELAGKADEPQAEVNARCWGAYALATLVDSEGARRHMDPALNLAERVRDRGLLSAALFAKSMMSQMEGDLDRSREFSDQGLIVTSQELTLLSLRTILEFDAGEKYLLRLIDPSRRSQTSPDYANAMTSAMIPIVARVTGVLERLNIAQAASDVVLSSP